MGESEDSNDDMCSSSSRHSGSRLEHQVSPPVPRPTNRALVLFVVGIVAIMVLGLGFNQEARIDHCETKLTLCKADVIDTITNTSHAKAALQAKLDTCDAEHNVAVEQKKACATRLRVTRRDSISKQQHLMKRLAKARTKLATCNQVVATQKKKLQIAKRRTRKAWKSMRSMRNTAVQPKEEEGRVWSLPFVVGTNIMSMTMGAKLGCT